MKKHTPWEKYQLDLQDEEFMEDAAQAAAVKELDRVYQELIHHRPSANSFSERLRGLFKKDEAIMPAQGLYMWGGVGRGKTYLMDTFYECLPFKDKMRMHFHRFMQFVHGELKTLRDKQDPLKIVADRIAGETRVICFDEFFVSDIADAMILAGLFKELFHRGVTLVGTSNIEPDGLYKDGMQRDRFLPAIEMVKTHTRVLNVDGGTDYRLRFLEQAEIYHSPLDDKAEEVLKDDFDHLAPEPGRENQALDILGRDLQTRWIADGVVWFDFEAICDGPRSQNDYIEIARTFHSVVVSNVPVLTWETENQARRFINMVDEFYDRNVKVIMSAEAQPHELYQGKKLVFEFERTVSRLQEMQSHDYLAMPHLP